MKIKEAAAYCGLTEKAIRLYESKGLITPVTEEKNGRIYREYDDDAVRMLMSISILRQADFTIDQIGRMQNSPELIPKIFDEYRKGIVDNSDRLSAIKNAVCRVDADGISDIGMLAERLAAAALPEVTAPRDTPSEPDLQLPPPETHDDEPPTIWDEDITESEKDAAYRQFLIKQERRERIEGIVFAIPRRIGALWELIPEKTRRIIKYAVPLVSAILLVLFFAPLRTPFNHTINGVMYCRDKSAGEQTVPVSIKFEGELYRYLFKKDCFRGRMEIEGFELRSSAYPYSYPSDTIREAYHTFCFRLYYEELPAYIDEGSTMSFDFADGDFKLYKQMMFADGFENPDKLYLVIPLYERTNRDHNSEHHSWNSAEGWYIAAPAESADDAEYLVRKSWERYNEAYPSDQPVK